MRIEYGGKTANFDTFHPRLFSEIIMDDICALTAMAIACRARNGIGVGGASFSRGPSDRIRKEVGFALEILTTKLTLQYAGNRMEVEAEGINVKRDHVEAYVVWTGTEPTTHGRE
ncbi:MAG: hypothetical protein IJ708_11655 [Clostridia bacterium]|nr:hypothetical protein [Clostridia bacterium]